MFDNFLEDLRGKPCKPFWRWLREWRDPNRSLRMHILKKLINFGVKLVGRSIPQRVPTRPATSLWTRVEHRLERVEALKRELKPRDKNLLELLEVVFRAVRYLAEKDPYYQVWLGYFMKRVMIEYGQGFKEYTKILNRQAEEHPEFPQLRDPQFQLRAWHLKMCGGLQLIDEKLKGEK